jgi:hypothetical protein
MASVAYRAKVDERYQGDALIEQGLRANRQGGEEHVGFVPGLYILA